jgi:hypothetical protein
MSAEYRTREAIALALDWGNVPPLDVLVKDIRARRAGAMKMAQDNMKMVAFLVKAADTFYENAAADNYHSLGAEIRALLETVR